MQQSRRFMLTFGGLMAIGPFAINMYLPSLPALQRDFEAHPAQVQLTLAAYFLGLALGQIPWGALSDRMGRRRPMLIGVCLFTAATVACALATSINVLIGARLLQAIGGCANMVIIRAIIRDLFTPVEGARVFSALLLVMGVAPIIAPLLGSWLLAGFGWRGIFVFLGIYGTICALTIWRAFPETRKAGTAPAPNREPWGLQLKLLFTDRIFVGNALAGGFSQAAIFAYLAGSPFVFIEFLGYSPQAYGWIFAANAIGLVAGSQLNRVMLPRYGLDGVMTRSGSLAAAAGTLLLVLALNGGGLAAMWIPMFICVFTQGFVLPNTSAGALTRHPSRAGFASGVLGTLQFTMGALPSIAIGMLEPQSAVPLAAIICLCTTLSLVTRRLIVPRG
jgi:DHA1 family bicyclomycin/chloramphenicol resistance-like MFS transporter